MARAKMGQEDMQLKLLAENMTASQGDYESALKGLGIWDKSGSGGDKGRKGGGRKVEVKVKPVYVPEEGTPDFVKNMIQDLQKQVGQTKDVDIRTGMLMDIQSLQEEYKSMTTLPKMGDIIEEDSFTQALSPLQQLNEELRQLKENLELAPDTSAYQEGLQAIADKEKEIKKFKGETDTTDTAKDTAKAWNLAASSVSAMGSALQSIDDPGAKIMGIIGQAIANIALGFAQASAAPATTAAGIWGWIAAAVGGTATMISTIAAIHSATGYSEGGEIKGRTFSGDQIPAMLNAGEIVLNRAQAGNLASQLQGVGMSNVNWQIHMRGEDIYLSASTSQQRRGRGRIVTSNRQRN